MNDNFSRVKLHEMLSVLKNLELHQCRQIMQNYDEFMDTVRTELNFKAVKDHSKKFLYAEEKSLENISHKFKSRKLAIDDLKEKGKGPLIQDLF